MCLFRGAWSLELEACSFLFLFFIWPGACAPGPETSPSLRQILPIHRWKLCSSIPNIPYRSCQGCPCKNAFSPLAMARSGSQASPQPGPESLDVEIRHARKWVLKYEKTFSHIIPDPRPCQGLSLLACCLLLVAWGPLKISHSRARTPGSGPGGRV